MRTQLITECFTDKGLIREKNEDAVFCGESDGIHVFCVADGMGGHEHGEKASAAIVQEVQKWVRNYYPEKFDSDFFRIIEDFEYSLQDANRYIFDHYNNAGSICGSTISAMLVFQNLYAVFSLGDSRIYRKRGRKFEQLIKDDTWQNTTSVMEQLSEEEIKKDQRYGKLVQAMGKQQNVIMHRMTDKLKRGDFFLICTDGVYKVCGEDMLKNICKTDFLHKESVSKKMEMVKAYAYQNGAPDNLSMVLVRVVAV